MQTFIASIGWADRTQAWSFGELLGFTRFFFMSSEQRVSEFLGLK